MIPAICVIGWPRITDVHAQQQRLAIRRRLHKKSIFCTKSSPLMGLYVQSPRSLRIWGRTGGMGQLGLHESYANQFLATSRLILNSILYRGSCGSRISADAWPARVSLLAPNTDGLSGSGVALDAKVDEFSIFARPPPRGGSHTPALTSASPPGPASATSGLQVIRRSVQLRSRLMKFPQQWLQAQTFRQRPLVAAEETCSA
jgi:hypothetical protein